DSLAILHLIETASLKLIGPWTSIPGLYFGPGWYYLLTPTYMIFHGHPIAGVVVMILLLLLAVFLSWQYIGKVEAVIIATTVGWASLAQSAWNPFPMALISLCVLILLFKILETNRLLARQAFALGFLASLGFHFSTAFAIFYPALISLPLLIKKVELSP